MKRKAKTLALLGLGFLVVLGLLYWRFSSSFPFVDRRPKTEIFAEAFAKGNFKRCYRLMTDDYKSEISRSYFVDLLEREVALVIVEYGFGSFVKIDGPINARPRFRPLLLFPGSHLIYAHSITYGIEFSNGRYDLHLITTDMRANSPIQRFSLENIHRYSVLTPTPTPNHRPIS